jgi:hypothetical protein
MHEGGLGRTPATGSCRRRCSAHKSELAADKRYYDAADAEHAASLAKKIRAEYRAAASRSGQYSELRPRAFTELTRLYNEVARAGADMATRGQ